MDREIRKYLFDILNSIVEIESYFSNKPKRFADYCQNGMLRRAVQMNISIIGEATNRILKLNSKINITTARKIVDTRNFIIHGYDSISHEMIWSIIINHIPLLKKEILALISSADACEKS